MDEKRFSLPKNIVVGANYLTFVAGLLFLIFDGKNMDIEDKRQIVSGFVLAAFGIILACIPIVGWICELVVFVFAVIAAVKAFLKKYWNVPLAYKLACKFVKEPADKPADAE